MNPDRMTVTDAGRAFLAFSQGKKSETTIWRYRSELNRLAEYHGNMLIKNIRPYHLDVIFGDMTNTVSAGCYNNTFGTYNVFFRWCKARGYLDDTVHTMLDGHSRMKVPYKMRDRIPASQFQQLLDSAPTPRERILASLGLFTFLRQGSIKLLKLRDVDLENGLLNVQVPKTGDADLMPISAELDRELRAWLTWYSTHHPAMEPDWYLIPRYKLREGGSSRKGHMERTADGAAQIIPTVQAVKLEAYIKPMLRAIGWATEDENGDPNHSGMHDLRRSGARALYDELVFMGYDGALQRVRSMLHHRSVAMTELYLGLNIEREKRNKDLIGKPMFPSLVAENVIALDSTYGRDSASDLRQVR